MIFEIGNYYHLYNRGCNKENLFMNNSDYDELINRIIKSNFRQYVSIISYCLMPNHYHFIVKQESETSASKWMGFVMNGFVQHTNRKYSRSGTLFEGSVKSRIITDEHYLIQSSLYVHYNPVKSLIVKTPEQWEYSNYREWIGQRRTELADYKFIEERFISSNDYIELMKLYIEEQKENEVHLHNGRTT